MKLAIVLVLALVAVAAAQECNLECADCVNATGCTPCNRYVACVLNCSRFCVVIKW